MTNEEQEKPGEALVNTVEELLNVNYLILELLDQRLTRLEDQIEKKG